MRWFLTLALLPLSGLHAQNIVVIDQPTSPAYVFDFPPVTAEVVSGMPIRVRAGRRSATSTSTSVDLVCDDPATLQATLRIGSGSGETTLPLRRIQGACEYYAQLPSDMPLGFAEIFIKETGLSQMIPASMNGQPQTFGPGQLRVVPTRIAVLNGVDPAGPGMPARAVDTEQGNPLNLGHPAQPGATVDLSVIGYGSAEPSEVSIQLGDDTVPVMEAVPSGDEPGVHRLRFAIPDTPTYSGCSVPLVVRTGDVISNLTTLPVADSTGACPHRLGLLDAEKAILDSGNTIPLGELKLDSIQNGSGVFGPSFSIIRADARAVAEIIGTDAPLRSDCRLSRNWLAETSRIGRLPSASPERLNPGPVTVISPSEQVFPISFNSRFTLSAGSWRLHVDGGAEVAPFEHTFRVAPDWLPENYTALFKLQKDKEQQLVWNPAVFAPEDSVTLSLTNAFQNRLTCTAPAAAGGMIVPVPAFTTAIAETGTTAAYTSLGYSIRTSAAAPQVFRFLLVNGTEGLGVIQITTGFAVTRGLSVE